jgi:ABC-2 type transport system permease protein
VFIMGFSFSLMIWLPMMASGGNGPPDTFLTLMMGYALLLLGESCFWNTLGFDRTAAQFYFLAPVKFDTVLKAKNLAAAVVVGAQLLAITTVALVLRLPVTPAKFAEAAAATAVTTLLLMAAGNLGSVYAPRATDPSDVWRKASAGKTQALAIFISPLLAAPVVLAHLARYAFESEWAFWGTMALMAVVASVVYTVAMSSASEAAIARRESITALLSASGGPVSA